MQMSSARRIRGSASSCRPVACSTVTKLFKQIATNGCWSPKEAFGDLKSPPYQWFGFVMPVGVLQQKRQNVQILRHGRMLLAEGRLVDRKCPPRQGLGFVMPVGFLQ